jgi:hypothetical protein
MIRTLAPLAVTLLSTVPALAGVPVAVDPAEIPSYQVVRPGLAFGGQPGRQTLERLGEMGFRTVINLRTEREGAREEGLHSPSMWGAVLRILDAIPAAAGVNP